MITEHVFTCQHQDIITLVEYSVQVYIVEDDKRYARLCVKNSSEETRLAVLLSKTQIKELSNLLNAAVEYLDT